jgi:hypothetical protein
VAANATGGELSVTYDVSDVYAYPITGARQSGNFTITETHSLTVREAVPLVYRGQGFCR